MMVSKVGKSSHSPLNFWLKPITPLFDLIYPKQCAVCSVELSKNDDLICYFCENDLAKTHFENYSEPTPLDQLFWGRIKIERTYAPYYFEKEGAVQKLLHQLKYGHKPKLGIKLGELIVKNAQPKLFQGIDAIFPVPIHYRKEFQRGYNQSRALSKGISLHTGIPIDVRFLIKQKHTKSQTKRNKWLRWENVQETITTVNGLNHYYSHIIIVDDVITTGATLESLISAIQKNYPELRISVISFALTK